MAEQFHVLFDSDESARGGARVLESAHADGDQVFDARRKGNDVLVGCRFLTPRPSELVIELTDGRTVELSDVFYWTDAPRQGTHHPDGILWVSGQSVREPGGRVPLESVAPTILSLLGFDQPPSMRSAPALVGSWA
jgi:hypothetical protein